MKTLKQLRQTVSHLEAEAQEAERRAMHKRTDVQRVRADYLQRLTARLPPGWRAVDFATSGAARTAVRVFLKRNHYAPIIEVQCPDDGDEAKFVAFLLRVFKDNEATFHAD